MRLILPALLLSLISMQNWSMGSLNPVPMAQAQGPDQIKSSDQDQMTRVKILGQLKTMDPQDKRNPWGFRYFLKVEQENKAYAVPLLLSKEILKKNLGAYLDGTVLIKGTLRREHVTVGEQSHTLSVLTVEEIGELRLDQLGVDQGMLSPTAQKAVAYGVITTMSGQWPPVGWQAPVKDEVANALIFTSGAALIGSMIFK